MKRKRYNSDDYILDDQDFLEAEHIIESSPSAAPVIPQIVRTPKSAQKVSPVVVSSPSPIKSDKKSPASAPRGRTPKKVTLQKPSPPPPKKQVPIIKSPVKVQPGSPTVTKLILKPVTPVTPQPSVSRKVSPSPQLLTTPADMPPIGARLDKDKKKEKKKKLREGKKGKDKDSGTSSEEERWLDAIESGKLEDVDDELKKIKPKDPKLMTARQRAMHEKNTEKATTNPITQHLMSLPTGYKEKVLTAEAIQKAQLKSQKRKQLADEKREKDKRKTMERLLKKKDSKSVKQMKNRPIKAQIPRISYQQTVDDAKIHLPEGIDFPFQPQVAKEPPKPILCSIPNCKNVKRYNCSKTNVPLCSFKCYKLNCDRVKKLIC